jgi:hypothetical protein
MNSKHFLTISSLAIGVATAISAAPAGAVSITTGSLTFSDGAINSTPGGFSPLTGTSGNIFTVDFNRGNLATTTQATGTFATLIPGVSPIQAVGSPISPSTGNFAYVSGAPVGFFDYRLTNVNGLDFNFGSSVGVLNIASNSIFRGSFAGSGNPNFSLNPTPGVATFANGANTTPLVLANFDFSIGVNPDSTGSFGITVSAPTAAIPEPFTIIGTLIGGTAAFRMRKKLTSSVEK